MRVLVACESSGRVREAFRRRGHDAWSCDLLWPEDGSPFHYTGSILDHDIVKQHWDLLIAHPDCTYLTVSANKWAGAEWRIEARLSAMHFVRSLWAFPVKRKAIENPIGEYIEKMVAVFEDVRRVLRADGTLWLNMGDCYATGAGKVGEHPGGGAQGSKWSGRPPRGKTSSAGYRGGHEGKHAYIPAGGIGPMTQPNRMPQQGLKPKDLVGQPWRLAFALQACGWWLRSDIIWHKPNPMPESIGDRPTKAHEYLFLLAKSERYYYDAEAIKEASSEGTHARRSKYKNGVKPVAGWATGKGKHTATEHAKAKNGTRKLADEGYGIKNNASMDAALAVMPDRRNKRSVWTVTTQAFAEAHFATFPPALIEPCILAGAPRRGVVLDPFGGAGTTGLVADRHGRDAVLIELNPQYADMAERRITADSPLFSEVAA